jgi:phytoene synthase
MVTLPFTFGASAITMIDGNQMRDPETDLSLHYASRAVLSGISTLFALDATLAQVLRTTREPLVGQMRLTWWHEALTRLDTAPPPGEPVLQGLARDVLPHGVPGARLARMIDGWEELLEPGTLDHEAILRHATARGEILFEAAAIVLGASEKDPIALAGRGWALADLGRHLTDRNAAGRALALAVAPLAEATQRRWSRAGRPLGGLAHIARLNLAVPLEQPLPLGAPGRVARLLFHRLSGR